MYHNKERWGWRKRVDLGESASFVKGQQQLVAFHEMAFVHLSGAFI